MQTRNCYGIKGKCWVLQEDRVVLYTEDFWMRRKELLAGITPVT